jgi:uncharacterized protein HemX
MRAPSVLLNVLIACALGGVAGYGLANRASSQEIAKLRQERDNGLIREQELRAQLEEALAARATLAQEAKHLQEDLQERLRRLEEAAAKLAPPKSGLRTED